MSWVILSLVAVLGVIWVVWFVSMAPKGVAWIWRSLGGGKPEWRGQASDGKAPCLLETLQEPTESDPVMAAKVAWLTEKLFPEWSIRSEPAWLKGSYDGSYQVWVVNDPEWKSPVLGAKEVLWYVWQGRPERSLRAWRPDKYLDQMLILMGRMPQTFQVLAGFWGGKVVGSGMGLTIAGKISGHLANNPWAYERTPEGVARCLFDMAEEYVRRAPVRLPKPAPPGVFELSGE